MVFVPGHTGDFISGGHIPEELMSKKSKNDLKKIIETILYHHYILWDWREHNKELVKSFEKRIKQTIGASSPKDQLEEVIAYNRWELENRQAKYIVNSLRVYEYFGAEWMIPLWDYELIDFFEKVPLSFRYKQKLYNETLRDLIFPALKEFSFPTSATRAEFRSNYILGTLVDPIFQVMKKIVPEFSERLKSFYIRRNRLKGGTLGRYGRFQKHISLNTNVRSVINTPEDCLGLRTRDLLKTIGGKKIVDSDHNGLRAASYLVRLCRDLN